MTHIAQCPECSKKYKVPHLDKAWQCKACKVALDLPEAESPEPEPKQPRTEPVRSARAKCPGCGAPMASKATTCAECGHSLGGDPYAPPTHSGRPARKRPKLGSQQSMEESAARGAAKKELRKLGFLRFLIKFGLFTSCLSILFDVFTLAQFGPELLPVIELVVDLLLFWFLWSTNKALATVYGRPRPYVIIIACLYTLTAVFAGVLIVQIVGGLYAAMYWMFVRTLGKIQAIKDENPGAFADQDEVRSVAVDEKIHRRRLAEAKRASKERNRRLVIFGGVAGVLLIGLFGYKAMNKPPKPDAVVLEFQNAWNRGDLSAVATLADPQRRGDWLKKLQNRSKRRGWDGHPPVLEVGVVDIISEGNIRAVYPTDDGSLGVRFSLMGKSWVMKSLDYRDLPD